jgi:hypothetical protein
MEPEIKELVAEGLSDPQIAKRLTRRGRKVSTPMITSKLCRMRKKGDIPKRRGDAPNRTIIDELMEPADEGTTTVTFVSANGDGEGNAKVYTLDSRQAMLVNDFCGWLKDLGR